MVYELSTAPGIILKEYTEVYNIKQKELADRLGMSEKHISNLINGKVRLTEDVAIALEKIFPSTKANFWLSIEAEYRESIKRKELHEEIFTPEYLKKMSKKYHFDEVVDNKFQLSLEEKAEEVLKILGISSFENFDRTYSEKCVCFFNDGGSFESSILWLKKSETRIFHQNKNKVEGYKNRKLEDALEKIRKLVLIEDANIATKKIRKLLNEIGIYFIVTPAIKGSKIRGAISDYNGNPVIHISLRLKKHDNIWFAIFHELAHLHYDFPIKEPIVSFELDPTGLKELPQEMQAHIFARNILISDSAYNSFIKAGNYSDNSIRLFAQQQKITPDIVLGRLQYDGVIEYSTVLNRLKFDFLLSQE